MTSMAGWSVQMNFDKTGGRHWLWGVNTKIDSENFEVNDVAQLNGADGMLSERQPPLSRDAARQGVPQLLRPGRRQHRHDAAQADADRPRSAPPSTSRGSTTGRRAIQFSRDLATTSVSLTRGGPLMGRGPGWSTNVNVGNRASSRTRADRQSAFHQTNDDGASTNRVSGTVLDAARAALAVLGVAVLRSRDRAAAVHQHLSGGRAESPTTTATCSPSSIAAPRRWSSGSA